MATVADTTTTHKTPVAWYGWLHDAHGVFLQVDGVVHFRHSDTHLWEEVDLETLTTFAMLNGRVDLADAQALADGDKVYRTSRTLTRRAA